MHPLLRLTGNPRFSGVLHVLSCPMRWMLLLMKPSMFGFCKDSRPKLLRCAELLMQQSSESDGSGVKLKRWYAMCLCQRCRDMRMAIVTGIYARPLASLQIDYKIADDSSKRQRELCIYCGIQSITVTCNVNGLSLQLQFLQHKMGNCIHCFNVERRQQKRGLVPRQRFVACRLFVSRRSIAWMVFASWRCRQFKFL